MAICIRHCHGNTKPKTSLLFKTLSYLSKINGVVLTKLIDILTVQCRVGMQLYLQ